MGPLIFLLITCAAVPLGARFLGLARLAPKQVPERFLASAAVGFVLIGYATLCLGLTGHLTPWAAAVMLAAAAVLGLGNWDLLWEALLQGANSLARGFRRPHRLGVILLLVFIGLTFITALEPPSGRDFDGLAEHLAQAADYVRHARVEPLWYDHHSHFPSNMQMLYSLGLLYHSTSAAKLFHWFHGLLALAAAALIARRFMARHSGIWAAFVLATTPLFILLMGVSYVDLGVTAYGLIALFFFLRWYGKGRPQDLLLAALVAGCCACVKTQGLATYGVLLAAALGVVVLRWRRGRGAVVEAGADATRETEPETAAKPELRPTREREPETAAKLELRPTREREPETAAKPELRPTRGGGLGTVVAAGVIGLLICLPWFVRSYLNTGNPFYPFAYSILGGRHWSADRALGYQRHQLEFGLGQLPPQEQIDALPRLQRFFVGPRQPWKWVAAPFGLTFVPWEYEVFLGKLQTLIMSSIGPLWLAFLGLLVVIPGKPRAMKTCLWLFLPLWLWWFASMQLARYLVPSLALLTPAAGYGIYRALHGGRIARLGTTWALSLWTAGALGIALVFALPALPVVLGLESRDAYLSRTLDVYPPSAYIASELPPKARVATYGEVRCFYFNRDCLWAEYGHSDLINYAAMQSPADLVRRFRELGVTHVLINTVYLPGFWDSPDKTLRLLREGMDRGLLVPIADFPTRRNYLLLEVRQPEARQASGARSLDACAARARLAGAVAGLPHRGHTPCARVCAVTDYRWSRFRHTECASHAEDRFRQQSFSGQAQERAA